LQTIIDEISAAYDEITRNDDFLKELDDLYRQYAGRLSSIFYAIGSVVGSRPFPRMARDFQSIVGNEARAQILDMTGKLPGHLVARVGGGSDAIGLC
jgi:tryptophan synthase beta subunit